MEETREPSRVVTIIQARMNSSRLPNKPLLPLGNATVLEQVVRRVRAARYGAGFLIALSDDPADRLLHDFCTQRGFPCFVGSPDNVLHRVIHAARSVQAEFVVLCPVSRPLLDPRMLDACGRYALESGMDYITVARLPEGVTSEAIPLRTLERTAELTTNLLHLEHPASFASSHPELFDRAFLPPPMRLARQNIRFTLENEVDYHALARIYAEVPPRQNGLIGIEEAIRFMDNDPWLCRHSLALTALPTAA